MRLIVANLHRSSVELLVSDSTGEKEKALAGQEQGFVVGAFAGQKLLDSRLVEHSTEDGSFDWY